MQKVIYLAECRKCLRPLTIDIYMNLDVDERDAWLHDQLPALAEAYAQWRIEDKVHLCPECVKGVRLEDSVTWMVNL